MIIYFIERITDTYIKNDNGEQLYTKKNKYINYLAKLNLVNIKEYQRLVRKNNVVKTNIPIFLNDKTILFSLKSNEDLLYINYCAILSVGYNSDKIMFLFKNGEYLTINNINYKVIKKAFKKIELLINYKKCLIA